MGLLDCPDCGSQVSARAPVCPSCGRPFSSGSAQAAPASTVAVKKGSSAGRMFGGRLLLFGILTIVVTLGACAGLVYLGSVPGPGG